MIYQSLPWSTVSLDTDVEEETVDNINTEGNDQRIVPRYELYHARTTYRRKFVRRECVGND